MKSAVCTLFEKDYHLGLAALVNSLQAHAYEGKVYAGYRGQLPPWASQAESVESNTFELVHVLTVTKQIEIVFLQLSTTHHLTNYKPDFMLELMDAYPEIDMLAYIDPDIVINENWSYFEDWMSCGVALCEDVNSPIPENHPRRIGWRRFYGQQGYGLKFRQANYVNGGFVGLRKEEKVFLKRWQLFNQLMGEHIGDLSVTVISGGNAYKSKGFANCFDIADQDALNATIESYEASVSIIGLEAMGFKPGPSILPHAQGLYKPWSCHYLSNAMKGIHPRLVDKLYWTHAKEPILAHSKLQLMIQKIKVEMASLLGRFYSRK